MFEARIRAEVLKELVNIVSTLVDEVKIKATPEGLSLKAVDPAHVAMVEANLNKGAFEEYKVEETDLGIDIDKRFTLMFGLAAAVAGLAGVMYTPILSPNYHMGMDFLGLSFVVVVVGGMGSLPGAVLAGFLLGILQSFASMNEVKSLLPGIDQIIIYLVAIVILLTRPRGLMGRRGVMED